jgi:hypothetical protein
MPEKSPLLEEKDPEVKQPDYSEDEQRYLKGLKERMEDARNSRDRSHEEFDGMSYVEQYESNERLANTFIKPKENKEETNFQSGMIRQKLFALLSATNNLDLTGDISAYDADGFEVQGFGDAMEIIRDKSNEIDNDDEKKLMRQYELLKQGTVFVEELWDEKKKKSKKSNRKFDGTLKNFKVTETIKKALAYPCRNVIPGINVYLGDITQYHIENQPFIFTVDTMPYSRAEKMFGEWERWENVPRSLARFDDKGQKKDWTLSQLKEGHVEVLRYQDKPNNEYALIINGVLMTPIGLSLYDLWGYEDYNVAQQNLEPIHSKFAYGKSLVSRTKNKVAILDEMMRLAILKTQKSFLPPYINLSGRMVTSRVFFPGKISHGIAPNSLVPISGKETEGLTNSELAMIQELQESINNETVSPIFQGQEAGGDPTATQVIEQQKQAKMVLGLTIFSVSMLEWKLEWLRLKNLLAHWFDPEDQVVDQMRGVLKNKYRKITSEKMTEGEGMGLQMLIPSEEIPSDQAVRMGEDQLSQEYGVPVRMTFVSPEEITSAKLTWQIVVKPREKRTSEVSKLLFRAFMQDIAPLGPNIDYLREKMASVWEENPQKLFAPSPMPIVPPEGEVPPSVPTPEKVMGNQVNQALKVGV